MFNAKLLTAIGERLRKKAETIAVAESVTAGFLQAAFSTVPDGAKFFQGGITAYNLGQKYRHLNVNPIHAEACNCVSEQVAQTMALSVCHLFSSQWGMAITGYATRVPEGQQQLHAWYAIAHNQKIVAAGVLQSDKTEGEETQLYYVGELVRILHKKLYPSSPAKKKKTGQAQATKK